MKIMELLKNEDSKWRLQLFFISDTGEESRNESKSDSYLTHNKCLFNE